MKTFSATLSKDISFLVLSNSRTVAAVFYLEWGYIASFDAEYNEFSSDRATHSGRVFKDLDSGALDEVGVPYWSY